MLRSDSRRLFAFVLLWETIIPCVDRMSGERESRLGKSCVSTGFGRYRLGVS